MPPSAGIVHSEVTCEKTITPSRFHAAPPNWPTGHSVVTGPPSIATRFSTPLAWKPICLLSADQNGIAAPSDPTIGYVARLLRARR